jgi:hypothetical protein
VICLSHKAHRSLQRKPAGGNHALVPDHQPRGTHRLKSCRQPHFPEAKADESVMLRQPPGGGATLMGGDWSQE